MPNYYPLMLDVRGRSAIVIGGDQVAAEKAAALAACGAVVRVISPDFCDALLAQAEQGNVTLRQRSYQPGDLTGAFIVIAATSDQPFAEAIWREAQQRGQSLNIVDMPARCSFILPSILRRGQLTIAVSTEGASPSLSKRIRQRLEALFPPAYDLYLRLAAAARTHLRASGVPYAQRDAFFAEYMDSDILTRLETGEVVAAATITAALLKRYGVEAAEAALAQEVQGDRTLPKT